MAKFSCGDTVINIVTQQKGVICEVCPPARGRQLYRVRYDESLETCIEQNLEFLQSGQRKYSVVLCDEAHKMRNNETQTYRGMSRTRDYADSVVFLTANPIMLGENDLYNLLHQLEPYDFGNKEVFRNYTGSGCYDIRMRRPILDFSDVICIDKRILGISNIVDEKKVTFAKFSNRYEQQERWNTHREHGMYED